MIIILVFIVLILLCVKCDNAFYQQKRILKAIDDWAEMTKEYEKAARFLFSMERFNKTMFRLWDWGYKRIVPPEVLKEIEPYIEKRSKRRHNDSKE